LLQQHGWKRKTSGRGVKGRKKKAGVKILVLKTSSEFEPGFTSQLGVVALSTLSFALHITNAISRTHRKTLDCQAWPYDYDIIINTHSDF
jgi:hypothetical protein